MNITAQMVKELRERTGAGMMDCKKALVECDGDMAKSMDWLREKGISKAAKKGDRIAAEGLTRAAVKGNTAVVFEINSETDFVAKNELFLDLFDKFEVILFDQKPADMETMLASTIGDQTVNDLLINATATIGEKITLRRFEIIEKNADEVFGQYIHMGGKISTIVKMSAGTSDEVAKNIAMQITSMGANYITRDDMPAEIIAHEREIQNEILKNDESLAEKPENVLKGIIEGRITKSLKDMCLVEQEFFRDPNVKISQYLKEANAKAISFVRFVVGEGIEKKEDNFAEEVMNQAFGNNK